MQNHLEDPQHQHARDKAHACQEALQVFERKHQRAADTHEKAEIFSQAISQWEREYLDETHPARPAPILKSA